jgi:ribonuclease VapC
VVVDTSALLAMALREPDADEFKEAIRRDPVRLMSTASILESSIVLQRRLGEGGAELLNSFLRDLPVQIRSVDLDQLRWARYAVQAYGRGSRPARLNFGDCFSYALAKATGEPLLFKGGDFTLTDINAALP